MSNLIQFLWLSVYRIITRTATVLNSTFTFHLMDFSISSSYLRPHNFVIFSPVSLSTRYLSYRSLPVPTLLNSFISFPLCDDSLSLQSSCLQLNLFYCTKWPPSFSIFTNVKIIWKPRAQKICEEYLATNLCPTWSKKYGNAQWTNELMCVKSITHHGK